MNTQQEKQQKEIATVERHEELYQKAIDRFLDKTDFDCFEWLDENEQKEYKETYEKIYNQKYDEV